MAEVGALADGVVVGSAIVRMIEKHGSGSWIARQLEAFTRDLQRGLGTEAGVTPEAALDKLAECRRNIDASICSSWRLLNERTRVVETSAQ